MIITNIFETVVKTALILLKTIMARTLALMVGVDSMSAGNRDPAGHTSSPSAVPDIFFMSFEFMS